jgi:hypothetical protein
MLTAYYLRGDDYVPSWAQECHPSVAAYLDEPEILIEKCLNCSWNDPLCTSLSVSSSDIPGFPWPQFGTYNIINCISQLISRLMSEVDASSSAVRIKKAVSVVGRFVLEAPRIFDMSNAEINKTVNYARFAAAAALANKSFGGLYDTLTVETAVSALEVETDPLVAKQLVDAIGRNLDKTTPELLLSRGLNALERASILGESLGSDTATAARAYYNALKGLREPPTNGDVENGGKDTDKGPAGPSRALRTVAVISGISAMALVVAAVWYSDR